MSLENSTDSQNTMISPSQDPPLPPGVVTVKRGRGRPRKSTPPPEEKVLRPSSEQVGDLGLDLKARRALNRELTRRGLNDSDLPVPLSDHIIRRSRKGKAGQIVVRNLSGVQNSSAAQLARKLENEISPTREDLLEKLEASGTTNQAIRKVAGLLELRRDFSLARCVAEAGADVAGVLDAYTKGALALRKTETVLEIYRQMPHLVRDLARHAIDQEQDCEVCLGVGKVTAVAKGTSLTKSCPRCKGTGKTLSTSEHKAMAVKELLEISEIKPKKTGLALNVNQGVQVNVPGGGGDLLARMSKAADEVLYHQSPGITGGPIDAEVVEVEE